MGDITFADLLQNLSYGALFVALFYWTLKTNAAREARYLSLLDCYGEQLKQISLTLERIQEQTEHLVKTAGHEDKEK